MAAGLGAMGSELIRTGAKLVGGILMAGDKPKPVSIKPINISEITKSTINAQKGNLQSAEELASSINAFDVSELKKIAESLQPGIFKTMASVGSAIDSELSGELPQDVVDAIMNSSAARAISSGWGPNPGGGSVQNFNTLRNYGITSINQVNSGITHAMGWLASVKNFMPQQTSPLSFLPSLAQSVNIAQREQEMNYYNDIYNAKIEAAPDPMMASIGAALAESSGSLAAMYGQGANQLSSINSGQSTGKWWESGSGNTPSSSGKWWESGGSNPSTGDGSFSAWGGV